MAKKFLIVLVTMFLLLSAVGEAQCPSQVGQRVASAAVLGGVGAGIGKVAGGNRGMMIGGITGAVIGALGGGQNPASPRMNVRGDNRRDCSEQKNTGPYNKRVANAAEDSPDSTRGPKVLLVNYDRELQPIIVDALSRKGYAVIDRDVYQEENPQTRSSVDWHLEVTVRQQTGQSSYGGGGVFGGVFSGSGSGGGSQGQYQVSVKMTNAKSGVIDPSRTATMNVDVRVQESRNGAVSIARVNGYGSQNYYVADPRMAAAEAAIDCIFEIGKRP